MDKAYDHQPTQRSRDLRKNMTDAERRLWEHLRNRQVEGIRFNTQVPIGPFICDFVARTPKLIVEVDGAQHAARAVEDARRTSFLEQRGYRVLRFWNNDVLQNIEGILTVIAGALANTPPAKRDRKSRAAAKERACEKDLDRPSPSPSRSGGRGIA